MERHGKLLVLLLVLAALGVGGWFVLGGGGSPTPSETLPATPLDPPAASLTAELTGKAKPNAASPTRTTVHVAGARPEQDPEITAALAKFQGRVVSHDKQPAPERHVRLFRLDAQVALFAETSLLAEPIADFPDFIAGDATTDADGRFELAGVWPRAIYLLKVDADGPNPTLRLANRTPGPGETVDLGDIVLKDAAIVTGIVVDEGGDPIVGAMVRAADLPAIVMQFLPIEQFDPEGWVIVAQRGQELVIEMPAWAKKLWKELPVPTTLSGADGRFRLEGVEPGVNLVAATKAGRLAATQKNVKLDPGQTRDVGKLVLREGETASGRVVDRQGKPVAGVQVVVGTRLNMPPVAFGHEASRSDARGQFACSGLGNGDVIAAARREVGEPWLITEPQSIQKELVITLPSRHVLTVRLVSEASLEIASPRLRLMSFGAATAESGLAIFATLGFARAVPIAARENKLKDGRIQLGDLDAGKYILIASAAEHAPAMQSIDLTSDREVELRLPREQTIDVVVLDSKDAPIRNAAVYVNLEGKGPDTMPVRAGFSDAGGRVKVREANRTSAVIEATHPRYGGVAARVNLPASAPVILRLAEPGSIAGEVSEGHQPPALGKFMVVANRPWSETRGLITGMPAMTTLDVDGKFALHGLQPGPWRVQLVKSLQAMTSMSSMMEMSMLSRMSTQLPEESVDLAAGQTVQVRLDANAQRVVEGPSARISGTVFVDGRPGEGMVVFGWNEQQVSATVDASGQFDLGQIKVGSIYLRLSDGARAGLGGFNDSLWSRQVEVKEANDVTLRIDIVTGALAGVVLDLQGGVASGVRIRARAVSEPGKPPAGGGGSTFTDAEGRFELKALPAGRYEVTGDADDRGRCAAAATVQSGSRADVRMRLQRTYVVTGKLDRALLPLPKDQDWVWLSFAWQGPSEDGAGAVRTNGTSVQEDGTFTAKGFLPGRYRIQIHTNLPGEWLHDGLLEVVDRDVTGFSVRPVQSKPPPEKPETKKSNG